MYFYRLDFSSSVAKDKQFGSVAIKVIIPFVYRVHNCGSAIRAFNQQLITLLPNLEGH
jgi:hypothetical protein